MPKRIVSGIMLTLLIIGVITSVFHIHPAKAQSRTCTVNDDELASFHKIQEVMNNANLGYAHWHSIKDWLMQANGSDFTNRLPVRSMDDFRASLSPLYRWSLPNKAEWNEFAYVDDDSAELVIGVNDRVQSNYYELADYLLENGGELVDTVSTGDNIQALVADVPLSTLYSFVSEIETAGLASYIEPNIIYGIDFVPNDPGWLEQWGPQKIEADWAWNTTIGDPSVLVAVVDTGIDWNHPDLANNYVSLGYDWVNNDPDPMDDYGHGTHCAGVIAAAINNDIGIAGLAQVRVMVEKGLDESGSGRLSDLASAIIHAVDQGADIISCSWGSYMESTLLHEAVRYAYDHDVLVVGAAGNAATNIKHYPAAYNEVFAVTATDQNDDPASFTNFGNWVEVAAPGVQIYSTVWDDSYKYMNGTSMSAPHVSGVAALIWGRFPEMTRDQVWAQLQYTADDLGDPGFDIDYGYGRINARRAVEQAPAEHDVLILNWKTPSYITLGSVATINTTILNMGASDESGMPIQLLVSGSVVDSVTIGFLASGSSSSVSCSWEPTIEGVYNVTSYVVPVIGETIISNNALSMRIRVRVPQVVRVPDDYDTIQKAIHAAFRGDTVFVASGTYYENLWIYKEGLRLVGEDTDNTVIDGKGMYDVIHVSADNVRISGFTIRNSGKSPDYYPPLSGILLYCSEGHTINNTEISDNLMGIGIFCSRETTLRNNNITRNTYNFWVDGDGLGDFIHDVDTSNTVDGKPIYYWVNEHSKQVPSDAGYVAVVNSTDITVKDLNLTENYEGLLFAYAINSFIDNVNVSNSHFGIYFAYSHNNTANSNTAINNDVGIYLYESQSNNVNDNMLMNNEEGIDLYYSKDNTIDFNKLLNNDFGLSVEKSNNNTVSNNIALSNTYGINVQRSCYNTFGDNNMTTNKCNFGVIGDHLSHFIQDIDISNTVDGKPICYWVNQKDKEIPADAGYVAVVNSSNIAVRDLNLTNNVHGVLFAFTAKSLIENVKTINNTYGIYLYSSSSNTIVHNTVTSKDKRGVQMVNSSNNAISNNIITNNYIGIGLWLSAENNTIYGNAILNGTSGGVGLYLDRSGSNVISSNVIANNNQGILLYRSSINTLRNNNMTNNSYSFGIYGVLLSHHVNDVDTSNNVNGKPIYYWINQHDKQVPANAGYVAVVNSTGITAKDLNLSNNEQGILFAYTTNSTIMNVSASDNYDGICLSYSDDNNITDNAVTDNYNGIYLWRSDSNSMNSNNVINNYLDGVGLYYSNNNTVARNMVTDNGIGIDAFVSRYNYINGNVALRNIIGIYLYYSHNSTVVMNKVTGGAFPNGLTGICLTEATGNVISENMVSENQFFTGAGIYLEWSSNNNTIIQNTLSDNYYGISIGYPGLYGAKDQNNNNTIYHNNLIKNTKQVLSLNSINTWDNGYPSGGNYWSDYVCTGNPSDGSQPYIIDADNIDHYPFQDPNGWLLHQLTITSSPITGITITINGTAQTTPYTDWLLEGSYTLIMPETHNGYVWSHWFEDGDPNRTKTITLLGTTWTGVFVFAVQPHGPKAEFTAIPDTALTGESIKFDASASLPGWNGTHEMPITEYRWDFGDGNETTTSTPIVYHSFSSSGNYYVTLTVYAPGATPETDSTTKKVTITAISVGGYSFPIEGYTTTTPLTLYLSLIVILTLCFTMIKRKTPRRSKQF